MKPFTVEEPSTWRKVAMGSWSSCAEASIYGWIDVDATNLLGYIEKFRARPGAPRVTITHAVGKAVASAMTETPQANAVLSLGRVLKRNTIDVFFSVATDGGKNLAGQKVKRIDTLTLGEVAQKLEQDVTRIRERGDTPLQRSQKMLHKIPSPLVGPMLKVLNAATFDLGLDLRRIGVPSDPFGSAIVTNVGTLGIEQGFGPLIGHGRTGTLLTVGQVRDKVIAVDGKPAVRPVLTLGATFDHRIVDGHSLGRIASKVREVLEHPDRHFEILSSGARAHENGHSTAP